MSATFLLAFYTDVLGITAAAAGTLFLVARIWDAINDPIMGGIADKVFSKRVKNAKDQGKVIEKFRPYLLKGSWPVIIAAILMFIAPKGLDGTQKLIWAYATYILWGMTYTFINIPYGGLAAVMTQDTAERSKLSVSRGLGGLIGAMVTRIVVPLLLVQFSDNEAKGYLITMIVFGGITFLSYLYSYFNVKENIVIQGDTNAKFKFSDIFSVILKNRPFLAVSLASVAMLTGLLIQGSMNIYYFRENLDALELMALTGLTAIIPMLFVSVIVPKLVKNYGVKKTSWVSSLISALIFALLFFLPTSPWIYLGGTLIASVFMMIPNMIVWGMVSDCIDYNQYLSGTRQEGSIYGIYSFVRKMGQAFAGFFSGIGLSIVGYIAGADMQTTGTLLGIKFLTIGVPAIAMFIAFIAYYFIWNLTPEKQKEVIDTINNSNNNKGDLND
ncbi:MFS transporter [Thiospirochaeta perfilievii]|uniref:MFS transporter n=2 Tax=Thiospirochaeta perfilievii TaxID=252967 RepID=A0A5C1QJJ3_9SPIO|nr:MFS transporter [Thiospirochaeta perfilievii]